MSEIAAQKKKSPIGAILKFAIPMVISVGLCWLLFRDFDFDAMWQTITTECRFEWIALGLVLAVFSHIFRALRWRIQLRALGVDPPLFFLVLSIFGTYAVNLVFPRLGEVWRTGYIAARQRAQFTTVFGSMVADRLADTLTVLLLTLAAFVLASGSLLEYLGQNEALYRQLMALLSSPWLWLGVAALVAFGWWFFTRKNANSFVKKIQSAVAELWRGFIVVLKMPGRVRWLLLTVGIWGCYFMQMYVAFYGFGFTADVIDSYGAAAVLVVFVLSSISMGVPSNGGIGPWQWAVIFGLGIYGLDAARAGAFANLVLGCNTLLLIALGLFTFICIAIDRHGVSAVSNKSNQSNSIE